MKRIRNLCIAALISLAIFHWPYVHAMLRKSTGRPEPCPWSKLVKVPLSMVNFERIKVTYALRLKLVDYDARYGIQKFDSPTRPFWIRKDGLAMGGKALLAFVLAEQDWIMASGSELGVHSGDVVMDVGAHVGTFGDDALRRGASKVIMVEPDPVNVECIRRNFHQEIAQGRVVVVPEGAWSSRGTLEFHIGISNSGMGSFETIEGGKWTIPVPVRSIDEMVGALGIPKVDFLKMDIEGAEREALKGSQETLRHRPRIMLDAYHRPDDPAVLPALIYGASRDYREFCAVCSISDQRQIVPHAIFFQ